MKAELINYFGDDLMVVNAARVSYGKEKHEFDYKDAKLLKYLFEHKHTSVFRHPQLQFRIECPIFVERQLFKHQIGMCLSGDSQITFVNSSKGLTRETIKSLYDKWTKGRCHQSTKNDALYSKRRINLRKLRVLNEITGKFEIGHIKNIFSSGRKELFLITLENGKSLKCSKDHRIFTKKGWRTIASGLKAGDLLGCNGRKIVGTGLYRNKSYMEDLRKKNLSISEMAKICGCGYDNIRKWLKIHGLQFSKSETCFQSGNEPWNKGKSGYSLVYTKEGKARQLENLARFQKKGKDSRFWRGGITTERGLIGQWTRSVAKDVHEKYNYTCQKCGISSGRIHAHHIIPVSQDIALSKNIDNLITVCDSCHKDIHKTIESEQEFAERVLSIDFKPFEYQKRIGSRAKFKVAVDFSKIISIESVGLEETYDIEVEGPHHNFVANGIVVHNSANSLSGRYVDFSDNYYYFDNLRRQSKSSKQGSDGILDRPDLLEKISKHIDLCKDLYAELCSAGVAKEQARAILPLSLETQFIWTGSLLSFIHLWNLRCKPDAQEETRNLAGQMRDLVAKIPGNPFKYSLSVFFKDEYNFDNP